MGKTPPYIAPIYAVSDLPWAGVLAHKKKSNVNGCINFLETNHHRISISIPPPLLLFLVVEIFLLYFGKAVHKKSQVNLRYI
jgi:hypothetical protein